MKTICSKSLIAALVATLLFLGFGIDARASSVVRTNADQILLLVPDAIDPADPRVAVWLDAAAEEGLHVNTITDSQFLALDAPASEYVGLILPDQVHVNASDSVVNAVKDYVRLGGNLMIVFDAASKTPVDANGNDFYVSPSRFSDAVGVDYVLYSTLLDQTIGFGHIVAPESTWRALGVPPGKSMLYPTAAAAANPVQGVTSYYYGFLNYPSFVTQGNYAGTAFISSPAYGLVAGVNNYGNGRVLFVNTPLGYLKGYGTDGLLLHGFLRYFGVGMLQLPYLSPLPQGKGGLIVNVHTDCGNSLADIQLLEQAKLWDSGPFSIDFTAGPDCIEWSDQLGLDVPTNMTTQDWIRHFVSKGHEVGSHGGWIHDFYGLSVTEDNQNDLIPGSGAAGCSGPAGADGEPPQCTFHDLLVINKAAMEAITGKPVREYAAPEGNTPKWSVNWLEQNGIVAYYWVGNTGMAPTRGYREGQLFNESIWAVPITPYGTAATFEEFVVNDITPSEATTWLTGLVDFSVKYRTSRMIYFHEPGVTGSDTGVSYLDSVQRMLRRGKDYGSRFGWYTMTRLADFLSDRRKTTWQVSQLVDGTLLFDAASRSALNDKTWVLPKARYAEPVAVSNVTVSSDNAVNEWLVRANPGAKTAQFISRPLSPLVKQQ